MAQSREYPDLKFVESRAYGNGRDGKAVRYIVIHYTAGSERATSAEDGAAYDQRRTDGTSTAYFHDQNSTVQCVYTWNRANAARHKGNRLGIQHELCGTAQTRAQWMDAASKATLRNAAKQVARDCRKYDIPVRRLTVAQTRAAWTNFPNGPKGIVGHVDCTYAYPEDGGDHTDPGSQFPWDFFLDLVRAELAPPQEDDGMANITQEQFNERMDAWWTARMQPNQTVSASEPLGLLRRAPWNQVVGSDGKTMYQVIFEAAATYPAIMALAATVQAFIEAEGVDDDAVEAKLADLRVALSDVQAAVDQLDAELPGDVPTA